MRKTMRKLSLHSRSLGRGLNPEPPKYKGRVLPTLVRRLVDPHFILLSVGSVIIIIILSVLMKSRLFQRPGMRFILFLYLQTHRNLSSWQHSHSLLVLKVKYNNTWCHYRVQKVSWISHTEFCVKELRGEVRSDISFMPSSLPRNLHSRCLYSLRLLSASHSIPHKFVASNFMRLLCLAKARNNCFMMWLQCQNPDHLLQYTRLAENQTHKPCCPEIVAWLV
jgi:hypothetical protein